MFNIGSEYCILCTQDSSIVYAFLIVVSFNVLIGHFLKTAVPSEIHRFYFSNLSPSVPMHKHSSSVCWIFYIIIAITHIQCNNKTDEKTLQTVSRNQNLFFFLTLQPHSKHSCVVVANFARAKVLLR